jgi:hypothetical protein
MALETSIDKLAAAAEALTAAIVAQNEILRAQQQGGAEPAAETPAEKAKRTKAANAAAAAAAAAGKSAEPEAAGAKTIEATAGTAPAASAGDTGKAPGAAPTGVDFNAVRTKAVALVKASGGKRDRLLAIMAEVCPGCPDLPAVPKEKFQDLYDAIDNAILLG